MAVGDEGSFLTPRGRVGDKDARLRGPGEKSGAAEVFMHAVFTCPSMPIFLSSLNRVFFISFLWWVPKLGYYDRCLSFFPICFSISPSLSNR